LEKKTLSLSKN